MPEKAHNISSRLKKIKWIKENNCIYVLLKKCSGVFISYNIEHIASACPWYLHHIQIMIFSTLDEVVIIQKSHNKHRH